MENIKRENIVKEFEFKTSRSGGKGGQNVNKVETRIELIFDVISSVNLNEKQKSKILKRLKNKIGKDGRLRIVSQTERSQFLNKISAIEKFFELMEIALKEEKKRIKTKPNQSSVTERLESKQKTSIKKKLRKSGLNEFLD
ncbi:MAG: Peptidyl-tRNA hydrolase ArfB [Ignavibacteria bacterium]|nr:Peptidyl-tRNA hydrolase ArfB [Ignavibacteria bacterium]